MATLPSARIGKLLVVLCKMCFAALLFAIGYTVVDNQRVVVVEQQVVIQDLPEAFESFRIMQISDLHGRYFGKNQKTLSSLINQTQYDMLAITGDMSESYTETPDNQAFFDLLDGIRNKDYVFYASGNTGPWGIETFAGGLSEGALTAEGEVLEAKGVHNLNRLYSIQRGADRIWTGEFWLIELIESFNIGYAQQKLADPTLLPEDITAYQDAIVYGQQLVDALATIAPDDVLLGITHTPFSIDAISDMPNIDPPYDLILAGHYHGGQIRIPFLGAVYIPDGASKHRGFFLKQDQVSGLKDWGPFQQYISRGLGASSSIRWLSFRLFNTPEINVITLVSPEE